MYKYSTVYLLFVIHTMYYYYHYYYYYITVVVFFVLFLCKCRFCNLFVVFGINHRLNSVQLDRPLDSNGEPMLLKLKVSYLLAIYVFSPFL